MMEFATDWYEKKQQESEGLLSGLAIYVAGKIETLTLHHIDYLNTDHWTVTITADKQ